MVLYTDERSKVTTVTDPQGFTHLPRGKVSAADIPYHPFSHEIIQRSQCFFYRRCWVHMMEQIDVDIVGL